MKFLERLFFFTIISCFSITARAQFITVDDQKTPKQLVEDVLIKSSCLKVTNITGSGNTFSPGKNSYGYFTKGTSNFPFKDGVVLNNSNATKAIGPPDTDRSNSDSKLWPGDADLDNILGISTLNATSIEFDFESVTDFLSFNYFFASKEYQKYFPCQFSDGFAFLIKEKNSTDSYQNLAVIPGTTTPVSSFNIHKKIPIYVENNGLTQDGCNEVNLKYYNGDNTDTSPINYNGQTKILTAQTNVKKGTTYHIKLVIADDNDQEWDSAVFIEAGSFTPKINLGQDRTLDNNPPCFGETIPLDPKLDLSYTYKWYKNEMIQAITTPTFSATESGKYKVEASPTSGCAIIGEINLEFSKIVLNTIPLLQCDDDTDGKTIFDLTKVEKIIKSNNANITSITYYESLDEAKIPINAIANATNYKNKSTNQTLYTRVSNTYNCTNYGEIKLQIANNIIPPQNPIATCDEDDKKDGLYQFDLKTQVNPQLLNGLPNGLTVEYYLTANDALFEKNTQDNIFKNSTPKQIIYARIVNGADCYGITPITLMVNTFDPPGFEDVKLPLCDGTSVDLEVATGFFGYKWSTGEIINKITATKPDTYSVTVTDVNRCEKTKKFIVKASGIAKITNAIVTQFSGNENSILFEFTGKGDYEFSLDGNSYQDNPLTNVAPGKYKATARDKNGCGISAPFDVYVLDYPRVFSPNGDGFNDVWKIKNLDIFAKATVTIFDRYGKLLKQLSTKNASWDGYYNGISLPADDYWFSLELDNRTVKGHFSLKR
jgi:gliding motility-associated-like protein